MPAHPLTGLARLALSIQTHPNYFCRRSSDCQLSCWPVIKRLRRSSDGSEVGAALAGPGERWEKSRFHPGIKPPTDDRAPKQSIMGCLRRFLCLPTLD